MDLERLKLEVHYSYVKLMVWKWRLTRTWAYLSNLQKALVSLGLAGSAALFYFAVDKYLERRQCSSEIKGIGHKEEKSLSSRRKNGNRYFSI